MNQHYKTVLVYTNGILSMSYPGDGIIHININITEEQFQMMCKEISLPSAHGQRMFNLLLLARKEMSITTPTSHISRVTIDQDENGILVNERNPRGVVVTMLMIFDELDKKVLERLITTHFRCQDTDYLCAIISDYFLPKLKVFKAQEMEKIAKEETERLKTEAKAIPEIYAPFRLSDEQRFSDYLERLSQQSINGTVINFGGVLTPVSKISFADKFLPLYYGRSIDPHFGVATDPVKGVPIDEKEDREVIHVSNVLAHVPVVLGKRQAVSYDTLLLLLEEYGYGGSYTEEHDEKCITFKLNGDNHSLSWTTKFFNVSIIPEGIQLYPINLR